FPFWVPRPVVKNRSQERSNSRLDGLEPWCNASDSEGYVELPYTLPQDSTLFLLFGERTPDVWLQKLDWIARHGGMALLDVHPDYVRFDGEVPSARTFPADHYADFLEYVRNRYG